MGDTTEIFLNEALVKIIRDIEEYSNFSEILADAAKVFSERIFLVEGEREYSFDDFNRLVNRCSRMLASEGVKPGDIVSLVLKNSVDYLILYFATLKVGCKVNPFPFHLGSEEIREKLQFIRPKVVYAHALHADKIAAAALNIRKVQSDKEMILGGTASRILRQ